MTNFKSEFGLIPKSVLNLKYDKFLGKIVKDDAEEIVNVKGRKVRLSEVNPALAYFLIKYWSRPGDTVLDPFGNRGSFVMVANYLKRNAIFNEIVPRYFEHIKAKAEGRPQPDYTLQGYQGNANALPLPEQAVDLVVTSPPFWDIEPYDSVPGQQADIKEYDDFLIEHQKCLAEAYRVLKTGKYCIYEVNDFRKKGKLYNFHGDTIACAERAGFKFHDILINVIWTPFAQAGMVKQRHDTGTVPKAHEYVLVFKKE